MIGDIEVALMTYDYDGKLLNAVTRKIPIHLQPDVLAALQKVGFQFAKKLICPVATSIYRLVSSISAPVTPGTLGIPLHVNAVLAETK